MKVTPPTPKRPSPRRPHPMREYVFLFVISAGPFRGFCSCLAPEIEAIKKDSRFGSRSGQVTDVDVEYRHQWSTLHQEKLCLQVVFLLNQEFRGALIDFGLQYRLRKQTNDVEGNTQVLVEAQK